ncbi:MAG TPA: type II secretion system F family protein [Bryobacteraceae bacterium]|nr:type II secretion system F family protein [Bryobacteraceae bacterium]
MNSLIPFLFAFLILFVVVMIAASVAYKFWDNKRKKQVSSMLQTGEEKAPEISISNLLMEPTDDGRSIMEKFIEGLDVAQKLQAHMSQAGLNWTPMKFLVISIVCAIIGGVVGVRFPVMGFGVTSVVFGLLMAILPYLHVRRARAKRLGKLEEQFPEALEFLARSMRAGHAFTISLEMLGEELPEPLGQEFRTLFNEQNLGAALEVALANLTTRVPLLDMRFFASSVLLQKQTGGNLAEILTRLAEVIRDRFRLKGQVKAASAHGRLTATILMLMPIATMFALLVVSPGYLQGMAKDIDGKYMIGFAILGQILGNYFIRKIINIQV